LRFWDSSAVIPLLISEPKTRVATALLAASEERLADLPFVTLDDRLADAARKEGFPVLPE
jgi:predicted nucleic acid-binding protein